MHVLKARHRWHFERLERFGQPVIQAVGGHQCELS
jgi:hypothetical protein